MYICDLTLRWASKTTGRDFKKVPSPSSSQPCEHLWICKSSSHPSFHPPLCRSSQNLSALRCSEPWRKTPWGKTIVSWRLKTTFPLIWFLGSRKLKCVRPSIRLDWPGWTHGHWYRSCWTGILPQHHDLNSPHGGKILADFFSLNRTLILVKALSGAKQLLPRVMLSVVPPSLREARLSLWSGSVTWPMGAIRISAHVLAQLSCVFNLYKQKWVNSTNSEHAPVGSCKLP